MSVLAGCTSPGLDPAASAWLDQVTTERANATQQVGVAGGVTRTSDAVSTSDGITLTLQDEATISVVEVRCFGGGTVTVNVQIQTPSQGLGIQSDIPCDEAGHDVHVGGNGATVPHVTSITVNASSPTPTTFYAEILP